MSNSNNVIESLIECIKKCEITWTSMDYIKKYLKQENRSLRNIQTLQLYAIYLQENKFLFDCTNTYLALKNDKIFILAKNLNSFDFRLDIFSPNDSNAEWKKVEAHISILLRLNNAIILTNEDSNDECKNILNILENIQIR